MIGFRVDRRNLPKPWANPLVFELSNGEATLSAEVRQDAAIEYQSAWGGGWLGWLLAPARVETFVLTVEQAVGRVCEDGATQVTLGWSDLNP